MLPNLQSSALIPIGSELKSSWILPDGSCPESSGRRINPQAGHVISIIEDILESMVDCLLDTQKQLIIRLKTRPKSKTRPTRVERNEAYSPSRPEGKTICFPGKTQHEAWKFSG
jgi:hypothetical protein